MVYHQPTFTSSLSTLSSVFSESLSGKVVLITGASSGIGEHLTYEYARRGALLALIARRGRREDALQEVADQAREYGSPDVLIISADVSKVEDLDHLVNNAGIALACLFKDATDITDFKTVMDINFWGSICTTRFALPHLRESRGKIIVLASSSWLPTPRMSFYNASSVAVVSFFETLRVEVGTEIKVTIVALGFIESEMTQGKFLFDRPIMEVDQGLRDVQVSTILVRTAIVNSACKGERYLTELAWFRVTYFWKVLGTSHKEVPSKNILDLLGAKNIIYPSTIDNLEIKID
ncbi:hypothetical protein ACJW30_04G164700 [Castanea mollissima]